MSDFKISTKDIQKTRKNVAKAGISVIEAAKRFTNSFNELSYRIMESAYLEEYGEIPDVSLESQRWAVREWSKKSTKN